MYCILRPCLQISFRIATRIQLKYVCLCIGFIVILDFFGAFTHVFEANYDEAFAYPYQGNVHEFVTALRHKDKPTVEPINDYNYTYIIDNKQKCTDPGYNKFRVVYIVKSAIQNTERRAVIRNTWGFEKRFFDVPTRTVFLLGTHPDNDELQAKIKIEAAKYKDIIQANFIDSYYNNTIKTMMGFKWMVNYCSNSKFYMFVDDDIYVSVKNVLRFIRNPANYPDYLKEPKKFGAHKREVKESDLGVELPVKSASSQVDLNVPNTNSSLIQQNDEKVLNVSEIDEKHKLQQDSDRLTVSVVPGFNNTSRASYEGVRTEPRDKESGGTEKGLSGIATAVYNRTKRQIFDFELPDDVRLFAGFVFVSAPHRHKSSKWYVPLSEYPYHLWPPYITAGAYVLSKEALMEMYYTSLYTKHFRFDDIFLGLVAKKADIEPFHCEEFHFYRKDYTKFNYKYVITSHGYGDPNELLYVWNEQKALGNA